MALGRLCVFILCALSRVSAFEERQSGADEIIRKSVAANQLDFKTAVDFDWKERDSTAKGSKTYQVTMIEGTPYNRLLAVNGKALSSEKEAEELKKEHEAAAQRRQESPEDRRKRIAKFEKERTRDNLMMEQLTEAFTFSLMAQRKVRGFTVWMLKATPRPGYKPPNLETEVLPGMQGELWIDQKTYNWVKVSAEVIRTVSIAGFLAQVQPGTRFEVEKSPVGNGIWQISHFSMKSSARILGLFSRSSWEDDTYFDYKIRSASVAQRMLRDLSRASRESKACRICLTCGVERAGPTRLIFRDGFSLRPNLRRRRAGAQRDSVALLKNVPIRP